mmetsp:Transcript_23139/g.41832  ORF Transcript_23139/g.41832 Transcript_23139/m.41832 type:complete len:88 (-) Transcript_23139:948-1211(-)
MSIESDTTSASQKHMRLLGVLLTLARPSAIFISQDKPVRAHLESHLSLLQKNSGCKRDLASTCPLVISVALESDLAVRLDLLALLHI